MRDGLYHRDVFFPRELSTQLPRDLCNIQYTTHAKQEAALRRITLPVSIYNGKVFEVQVNCGRVVKAGYRAAYSENFDLCLVVALYPDRVVGITVWVNHKENRHVELKRERYIQGKRDEPCQGKRMNSE